MQPLFMLKLHQYRRHFSHIIFSSESCHLWLSEMFKTPYIYEVQQDTQSFFNE